MIALHDMDLIGMWRSETIGFRLVVQSYRVDHQRIAFVMADRFAVPGFRRVLGVLYIHVDMADLAVARIDDGDFLARWELQHLHMVAQIQTFGNAGRPTQRLMFHVGMTGYLLVGDPL